MIAGRSVCVAMVITTRGDICLLPARRPARPPRKKVPADLTCEYGDSGLQIDADTYGRQPHQVAIDGVAVRWLAVMRCSHARARGLRGGSTSPATAGHQVGGWRSPSTRLKALVIVRPQGRMRQDGGAVQSDARGRREYTAVTLVSFSTPRRLRG